MVPRQPPTSFLGEGAVVTPSPLPDTSIWSFGTREFVKPIKGAKQMTATQQLAGAASHVAVPWHAINWRDAHKNVRRLQARIVQATRGKGDGGK